MALHVGRDAFDPSWRWSISYRVTDCSEMCFLDVRSGVKLSKSSTLRQHAKIVGNSMYLKGIINCLKNVLKRSIFLESDL